MPAGLLTRLGPLIGLETIPVLPDTVTCFSRQQDFTLWHAFLSFVGNWSDFSQRTIESSYQRRTLI